MYSIDNGTTLFEDETTVWNLNKLQKKDSYIHEAVGEDLPGVLTPFLYLGMKNTAFAMHVEDDLLGSVNIVHSGESKHWYVVPPSDAQKLEHFTQQSTTQYTCDLLIRHKLLLIPPSILKKNGIKFGKVNFRVSTFSTLLHIF